MTNSIKKKLQSIIKKIAHLLFFFIYGRIKGVIDCKKHQSVEVCKVNIDAHDEKNVEIILTQRNFSYWSIHAKRWQIKGGSYEILIGSSSKNIFLKSSINLEKALEVL